MAGVVVLAGLFPAGSVVNLVRVEDERVLRAEGGDQVDARVVDAAGNVGFDGLVIGDRFFACGYSQGRPLEVRCIAQDADAPSGAQAPVGPAPEVVGVQNVPLEDRPQAVPVGLEVGVPEGAASPVALVPVEVTSSTVPVATEAMEAGPIVPAALSDVVESPIAPAGPVVEPEGAPGVVGEASPENTERDMLDAQAAGLGIAEPSGLSLAELRQSIIEKNATPVA